MMALLGGPKQAAKVEIAIRELAAAHIGFVRISNPLVSPLSLERLVLQITRDKAGKVRRDNAERVLRALIARSDTRRQVVVVVEQAETLAPEALEFLHGLPGLSHPSLAPVQVALVGASAPRRLVRGSRTTAPTSSATPPIPRRRPPSERRHSQCRRLGPAPPARGGRAPRCSSWLAWAPVGWSRSCS